MIEKIKGYRTYICIAIAFALGGANAVGWIDSAMTEKIWAILGFLGLGFLRAGVSSDVKKG